MKPLAIQTNIDSIVQVTEIACVSYQACIVIVINVQILSEEKCAYFDKNNCYNSF